jgi:hypothetical protein
VAQLCAPADVADGGGSFRVTLEKAPPLCGNAFTYAYVGGKGDTFEGMVELLILAKSTNAPISLVSAKDGEGHCKLVSVTVK